MGHLHCRYLSPRCACPGDRLALSAAAAGAGVARRDRSAAPPTSLMADRDREAPQATRAATAQPPRVRCPHQQAPAGVAQRAAKASWLEGSRALSSTRGRLTTGLLAAVIAALLQATSAQRVPGATRVWQRSRRSEDHLGNGRQNKPRCNLVQVEKLTPRSRIPNHHATRVVVLCKGGQAV